MKRLFLLITLIFSMLLCVASTKVNASETYWYNISADKVGNPVLLENEQYYQGVSINSHIISDLTFLEIPFEKYLDRSENQFQIIAFTEALYKKNKETVNEVVMYLYAPLYSDYKSVETQIDIISKEVLQNGVMVDATPEQRSYKYTWTTISSYERLYKMSFSYSEDKHNSISKILLSNNGKTQDHTITSTVFDCKILEARHTLLGSMSSVTYQDLLVMKVGLRNQQFNFIYEKNYDNPEAIALLNDEAETPQNHYTTSIGYNETTAKVSGDLFRLRYGDDVDVSGSFLQYVGNSFKLFLNEYNYVDVFYYFFNVKDAATGKAWTGDEVITKLTYTYYEYMQEFNLKWSFHALFPTGHFADGSIKISYLYPNGNVYAVDEKQMNDVSIEQYNSYQENNSIFNEIEYRNPSSLSAIYQQDTVVPGTFENKYPVAKDSPSVFDFLFGTSNDNYITQMPYLFSTSDTNYVTFIDKNIYGSVKLSDYQYGVRIGKDGYPVVKSSDDGLKLYENNYETRSCVKLVSVDDIWYEYEGEKYHASVVETIVDDSLVNIPIIQTPGNSLFPTKPDENKSWWEKFLEFLKELWAWLQENYKVLIFWASVVVVSIVGIKVFKGIMTYKSQKALIELNKKKKE